MTSVWSIARPLRHTREAAARWGGEGRLGRCATRRPGGGHKMGKPGVVTAVGYQVDKTDAQWREELSDQEFAVLRQAATERPFTGELLGEDREGVYRCRACGAELFRSRAKFESGCGWPSFFEPTQSAAVELRTDTSHGMVRTEVRCAACGSHLGHVFDDAPQTPTGDRYCMNSIALTFEPAQ